MNAPQGMLGPAVLTWVRKNLDSKTHVLETFQALQFTRGIGLIFDQLASMSAVVVVVLEQKLASCTQGTSATPFSGRPSACGLCRR
jgi:hypothetical protein